jgi:hypothetical protein
LLRKEVLHDLPPGGAPDAGVRANVFEHRVQRTDPVRLAGDEGWTAIAMTRGIVSPSR